MFINNRNKSFIVLCFTVLIFIIYFLTFGIGNSVQYDGEKMLNIVGIIIIIQFLYSIITLLICGVKIDNLSFIYLTFYFIFLFGQVVCRYVFGFVDEDSYDFTNDFSSTQILQACIISLYGMITIHLGILLGVVFSRKNKIYKEVKDKDMNLKLKVMNKVAWIVVVCSAPFALYELFDKLKIAFASGYKGVYSDITIGVESLVTKLVPFFLVALLVLMVSYKNDIKKAKKIFVIILIYNVLQFFLGARGLPILRVLFTIIAWNLTINKITTKKMIIYFLLLIPLSILISFMRVVREYAISEWISDIGIVLNEIISNNPVLLALNEMGNAIFPTTAALVACPEMVPFKWGTTYLYGIAAIIPNLGTELSVNKVMGDIQQEISKVFGLAFGGSIVEDLFANFGWLCLLALIILGIFMYKIDIRIKEKAYKSPIVIPLYLAFCVSFVWTVRNNINPIFREFVWYILPIYVFYKLLYRKVKKGERKT